MQYVHDAQLIIGGLEDKLKVLEHDAATRKNICAQCKAKMKTTKLDALAPPELAGMADELKMAAREYAIIFQPWPPVDSFLSKIPDNIDPDDYEQRYPAEGQEDAEMWACAKELHDYLPDEFILFLNHKWVKATVSCSLKCGTSYPHI